MYRVQNSGTANRRKSAREGEVGTEVSNAGRGKTARVRGKERDLIRAATLKFPISFDAQCSYRELRREFLVFLVYTVPTFSRRVLVRQLMSYSRCKKRKTWIGKEKKREREGERGRGNDRKNDARRTDRDFLSVGLSQLRALVSRAFLLLFALFLLLATSLLHPFGLPLLLLPLSPVSSPFPSSFFTGA